MTSSRAASSEYDARIRRAEKLAAEKSSAKEILAFYVHIATFQKNLFEQITEAWRQRTEINRFGAVRDNLDLAILLPHFRGFLALVERDGPRPLAYAAGELTRILEDAWAGQLAEYWQNAGKPNWQIDPYKHFFPRAFLEPYAMYVSAQAAEPPVLETPRVCPLCGGQPMLGVLRPEGDGGRRCLICCFCGHEWNFRRIWCAACGEADEKKLPVYVAEQLQHIRVEACDTCKFFLRTIDLTKDGNAVPVVDDLGAIVLALWTSEHGYTRLQANLLGS